MAETEESEVLNFRLPVTVANRLREAARQDCRTVGSLVRKLVVKGLESSGDVKKG